MSYMRRITCCSDSHILEEMTIPLGRGKEDTGGRPMKRAMTERKDMVGAS
jgi:hypothetical protein